MRTGMSSVTSSPTRSPRKTTPIVIPRARVAREVRSRRTSRHYTAVSACTTPVRLGWTEPSATAEPAQAAARAEVLLLGDEGDGRFLESAGRLRSGEEVDVDATDAARAELDVAGPEPVVGSQLLAVPQTCDQRSGDHAGRAFREHACLRHPDRRDVPDGVHARKPRLER